MAIVERGSPVLSAVRFNPLKEAESLQVSLNGTEVVAATSRFQARNAHIVSAREAEQARQPNTALEAAYRDSGKGTKFSASA